MITLRSNVDRLLHDNPLTKNGWIKILSNDSDIPFKITHEQITQITVFTNFFQELGAALVNKVVDKKYTWDIFGGLVERYGKELKPFIEALRFIRKRETLYSDFTKVIKTMSMLDTKYK